MFTENQSLHYEYFTLFRSASVWFAIFLAIVIAITPDLLISVYEQTSESQAFLKLKDKCEETMQVYSVQKKRSSQMSLNLTSLNQPSESSFLKKKNKIFSFQKKEIKTETASF